MRAQILLLSLALGVFGAVEAPEIVPKDEQRPMRPVDKGRYRAACPDYSQYSKFALQ